MILCVVTDEISMDFSEAINLGVYEGIYHYELRSIGGYRFPNFPEHYLGMLKEYKKKYGIIYTSVSPGIFKLDSHNLNILNVNELSYDKIFELTRELGVERIIIFAYEQYSDGKDYKRMVDEIYKFVKKAGERGFTVSIENSATTAINTARDVLRLIEDVGLDNFKINWDPGNACLGGCLNEEEDYRLLSKYIDNIHMKDIAVGADGEKYCVPIGEGLVKYESLLSLLRKDGYQGYLTIETHCKPSIEAFKKSLCYLRSKLLK